MGPPDDAERGRRESLDIPVERIGSPGSGGSRRALVVVIVVAVGLVGAIGLAIVDRGRDVRPRTAALQTPGAPSAIATAPATPATSAARESPRPEPLPDLANVPMPDAPLPVFHRRSGDDLERLVWVPGEAQLRVAVTVPGAFAGVGGNEAVVVASPDGSRLAVRSFGSFHGAPGDRLRVLASDGRSLWTRDDADGLPFAPIWSADGRRLLLPDRGGSWRILDFKSSADPAEVRVARADLAAHEASGYLLPLGFSTDGRWVYAGVINPGRSGYRPAARISTGTGAVEPRQAIPADGPEAVAPLGRFGYEIDPPTGRWAIEPGVGRSAGPTDVSVYDPDGTAAWTVRMAAVMGLGWTGDGRLLAVEVDTYPRPNRMRVLPIDGSGDVGAPLLEAGPLTWASLVGVRDGYALLALTVTGSRAQGELVLLRLSDGATATLRLDPATLGDLQFGGWLAERLRLRS